MQSSHEGSSIGDRYNAEDQLEDQDMTSTELSLSANEIAEVVSQESPLPVVLTDETFNQSLQPLQKRTPPSNGKNRKFERDQRENLQNTVYINLRRALQIVETPDNYLDTLEIKTLHDHLIGLPVNTREDLFMRPARFLNKAIGATVQKSQRQRNNGLSPKYALSSEERQLFGRLLGNYYDVSSMPRTLTDVVADHRESFPTQPFTMIDALSKVNQGLEKIVMNWQRPERIGRAATLEW